MLKVINLLVGLRRLPPLSELTGEEERLLFELKSLYDEQGFLSVSDAYDLISGKSATTSYRNLMALKDKGLVSISVDGADGRKRTVHFTSDAKNFFKVLG